ncbi:hypothetical protein [Streptomyces sp. URMC 123]|uniref:hypothetical protein n=1 Tax=Streptomyces sp. URMC 123 TaxID=3423403 RepID=UPI003F1A4ECB
MRLVRPMLSAVLATGLVGLAPALAHAVAPVSPPTGGPAHGPGTWPATGLVFTGAETVTGTAQAVAQSPTVQETGALVQEVGGLEGAELTYMRFQ